MDGLILMLLALAGLLACSAFLSGSETALTAVSRPYIHQREQDGSRRARVVLRLLDTRDRLIGVLLLGNNLVNILASSLATGAMITLFGDAGIAYATVGMTVALVLFGEIMPKTYAIYNANKMALTVARPVAVLVFLLSPLVRAFELIIRLLFRVFGANYAADASIEVAMTELRGAIEVHASEEEVQQERKMLRSILDLGEVSVSDVMVHRKAVRTIDADLPTVEMLGQIMNSTYSRLPLWRDEPDNIIGVVHVRDILKAAHGQGGNLEQLDLVALASAPWFIPDTTTLLEQLQAFRARREHFAVVVDEYGSLQGVVTLEDILEEIVGDIADEHDAAVAGVHGQSDGSYIVEGTVTIRDLNREFEWRLPDDTAATIAGLLLHESRQIPQVGQVFSFRNFRFEVLTRRRNQITSIRITPPSSSEEED